MYVVCENCNGKNSPVAEFCYRCGLRLGIRVTDLDLRGRALDRCFPVTCDDGCGPLAGKRRRLSQPSLMKRGLRGLRRGTLLIFAMFAALGLLLSINVHALTFLGIDPIQISPCVWLLHLGIFVLVIPTMIACRRMGRTSDRGFDKLSRYAPKWMAAMTMVLFVYAFVNFGLFIFRVRGGSPTRMDNGTYAMTNHGQLVREIDEAEFHHQQAYVARGFSGHWMVFYSGIMTTLVSCANAPELDYADHDFVRRSDRPSCLTDSFLC